MMRVRLLRVILSGVVLLLTATIPAAVQAQAPNAETATKTPIKHFITLMQENHSFDNYFGTYPGAEGVKPDTCIPVDIHAGPEGQCVKPFHIGDKPIVDLDHSMATARNQLNDGKMDAFVYALGLKGQDGSLTMGYYDDRDIPYYWNLADNYVLFDRMFSSAIDGSFSNHFFWVAGRSLPPTTGANAAPGDLMTIFDRLEAKGISWKFYVENYDPTVTYRNQHVVAQENPNRVSQIIWVPILNIDRFIDDPRLYSHIVDLSEYYTDLQNGNLPAVSYLVPSGASEHPPGRIQSGEKFVRGLIQELMRSSAWSSSAFVLSYDDWGGWYDHVPPPQIDDDGYGFRVPALLVSPYARQGFVDHTQYDFASIIKFIENNWTLEPLAPRDAQANGLTNAFDFNQAARAPVYLGTERTKPAPANTRLPIIYAAYGAVLLIAALFLVRAALSRSRPVTNRQSAEEN